MLRVVKVHIVFYVFIQKYRFLNIFNLIKQINQSIYYRIRLNNLNLFYCNYILYLVSLVVYF